MIKFDDISIGQKVYHADIYNGNELMTIVGMKLGEDNQELVLLEGDYSGGTHNVCQRDWERLSGVIPVDNPKVTYTDCGGDGLITSCTMCGSTLKKVKK